MATLVYTTSTWDAAENRAHFAERQAQRRTIGMCTACGAIEVALDRVTGHRDLSHIGESPEYPTGHGCEVCS